MQRHEAARLAYDELKKHGLTDWNVRINSSSNQTYLALCSYKDKCIILNAHHVDIHPEPEILNSIKHEVAHALMPGHEHNELWAAKAREIGCTNTAPCSHLALSPEIIDAIRSGADVLVEYETEIIHKPKYTITRLQDKCEVCGKVAKETRNVTIENDDPIRPNEKLIFLECGHIQIKKIPKGTPFGTLVSNAALVRDCKHDWNSELKNPLMPRNQCLKCKEFRPYPFQLEGMRFLEVALATNKGGAVFDEMGLGKTIQALGYLKFHPEAFPALFVVKSGIKFQWFKEILRWLGDEYLPQIINTSSDIFIPGLKCYIMSYDIVVPKVKKLRSGKIVNQGLDIQKVINAGIKTVILDECQQIKNPDSSRTQMIRKLAKATNIIALSGTPWKNRGSEFFTVLNMMAPAKFPTFQQFLRRWVNFYAAGDKYKEGGIRDVEAFREYTKEIAIRREIFEVMKEMPDVNRTLHYVELDSIVQKEYDDATSDFVKWYNNFVISGDEDSANAFQEGGNLVAKLSRMRHITGLAKVPATVEFAEEFIEDTDRKLTIFVHHKDVGWTLANELRAKFKGTIPVLALTADLSSEERFRLQEEFNNTPRAILIASTLASGEGLNLQTCSDAIMHERQWNPPNEDQAAPGRFRRIGQTRLVNVTFITAAGTVDDHLASIVERKRGEFHNAMNKGEPITWNQNDILKELAENIVNDFNKKQSKIKKMVSL